MTPVQNSADLDVDLRHLFASLARNWLRILLVALVVTGVALMLAWAATPTYKAETRLIIETRESVFTRPSTAPDADRPVLDAEGETSQVEENSSTEIPKEVVGKLELAKLPESVDALAMSPVSQLLVTGGL